MKLLYIVVVLSLFVGISVVYVVDVNFGCNLVVICVNCYGINGYVLKGVGFDLLVGMEKVKIL